MNKIQTLIAQHCPNGVEYKKLGEISTIKTGKSNSQDSIANGIYPLFDRSQTIKRSNRFLFDDEAIIIAGEGNFTPKYFSGKFDLHQRAYAIHEIKQAIPKFIFYAILSNEKYFKRVAVDSTVTSLRVKHLQDFPIPIPPIPVQEEIVRILDAFTNLQTELELRKKQYKYYRDKLLATKKDWKECKLIEVAMYSKTRIFAKELDKNNYVGVDNLLQNCSGKTESNYVPQSGTFTCYQVGDILIGNIRPYLKKIWYANNQGGTNGDVLTIRILEDKTNEVFSKFLYYVLSTDDFFSYNTKHSRGGKMPRGDKDKIINYQIPIPPLEEQKRIVGILDKFDGLVSDIAQGIPAEIEMRKKQYEYYRDSLLRFEEV